MPTPNYGYEKRQRELEKKRKKEEKAQAKAARKAERPHEGGDAVPPDHAVTDDADGAGDGGGDGGGGD
ncbi:hypothetical protein [Ottowia sp.]|uniref:hypothetical protein n=1 Tax=Ottowia sp. TaxID=1898956 RepID=UPI003A892FDC